MKKEEFIEAISSIGTIEDEVERRSQLANMQDEIIKIFDSNAELTETNERLEADNQRIKEENMKLFLRVSEPKDQNEVTKNKTGLDNNSPTKRDFNDLFDEKGGIK